MGVGVGTAEEVVGEHPLVGCAAKVEVLHEGLRLVDVAASEYGVELVLGIQAAQLQLCPLVVAAPASSQKAVGVAQRQAGADAHQTVGPTE